MTQTLSDKAIEHLVAVSDKNLDMHQKTKNISYQAINNIIFVVSTGTLVVSISFIGYLTIFIFYPQLLIASWFFIILTIFGNFIAHQLQIKQSVRQISLINEWRAQGFPDPLGFDKKVRTDKELNNIIEWGKFVNGLVIIFLLVGLATLFSFGSINLLAQNTLRYSQNKSMIVPIKN